MLMMHDIYKDGTGPEIVHGIVRAKESEGGGGYKNEKAKASLSHHTGAIGDILSA